MELAGCCGEVAGPCDEVRVGQGVHVIPEQLVRTSEAHRAVPERAVHEIRGAINHSLGVATERRAVDAPKPEGIQDVLCRIVHILTSCERDGWAGDVDRIQTLIRIRDVSRAKPLPGDPCDDRVLPAIGAEEARVSGDTIPGRGAQTVGGVAKVVRS